MPETIMDVRTIIDADRFDRWHRKAFKIIAPLPPVDKNIPLESCEYSIVTPLDHQYWNRFQMGDEAVRDAEKMFGIGWLSKDTYRKIKLCAHEQFLADWALPLTTEEVEELKSTDEVVIERPITTHDFHKIPFWAQDIYWSDKFQEWRCQGRPEGRDHSDEVHLKEDWRVGDYFYVQEEFAYEHGQRDVMGDGNGPDPNVIFYRDQSVMYTDFRTDEFIEVSKDFDDVMADCAGWRTPDHMNEEWSRFIVKLESGIGTRKDGSWIFQLRFTLVRSRLK